MPSNRSRPRDAANRVVADRDTPSKGATTWGGLWRVTDAHLDVLDEHEGVALGRYRRDRIAVVRGDEPVDAVVYIEPFRHDGPPRDGYLPRILRGGADFGLPAGFADHLLGSPGDAGRRPRT